MKKLGITKGEWQFERYGIFFGIQIEPGYNLSDLLNGENVGFFEAEHNAELICDAGNTAQKCGLLPSELLRQRDELREALKQIRDTPIFVRKGSMDAYKMQHIVEAAIKSTER